MKTTYRPRHNPAWSETPRECSRRLKCRNAWEEEVDRADEKLQGLSRAVAPNANTPSAVHLRPLKLLRPVVRWTTYAADVLTGSSPLLVKAVRRHAGTQSQLLPPISGTEGIYKEKVSEENGRKVKFASRLVPAGLPQTRQPAVYGGLSASKGEEPVTETTSYGDDAFSKRAGVGTRDVTDGCAEDKLALSSDSAIESDSQSQLTPDPALWDTEDEEYYTDQKITEWVLEVNASLFSTEARGGPGEEWDTSIKIVYSGD